MGYYFWYEMYPNQPNVQKISSPRFTCNRDQVYVEADWNTNASNESYIVVVDNTTGQYTNRVYNAHPDQSTAEWITERLSCSGSTSQLRPLANFGNINWTGADATAGYHVNYPIGGWSNYLVKMYDSFNYLLTVPTALGSGGNNYTQQWKYPGISPCS